MICTGKGNSGKNQDTVTLVSCEYAHWTLVAQVRPAPDYGGSTLWEIHRRYHILKLSGYLIWIISSIKLGSWSSWQKTLFHKIGSYVNGNFVWSRPYLNNFLTSFLILSHCSTLCLFTLQSMSSVWFNHFIIIAFISVAKGCAKTESADIWVWL